MDNAVYYRKPEAIRANPLPSLTVDSRTLDKDDYLPEPVHVFPSFTDLEVIFRQMNVVDGDELPVRLKVRSMMTGDVVVDEDGDVWFCAMAGWQRATW